MNNLYNRLEKERQKRKLSIKDFSKVLGVSDQTYVKWGKDVKPSKQSVEKVVAALDWETEEERQLRLETEGLFEKVDERIECLGLTNVEVIDLLEIDRNKFYRWRRKMTREGKDALETFLQMTDREIMRFIRTGERVITTISGSKLRALRESRGYTQYKLAKKIGVASSTVNRWESGNGVTKEYLPIVCGAFNIAYMNPNKRQKKAEEQWAIEKEQRRRVLNLLDVKYDGQLSKAPDDCPILNQFRELVGA